MRQICLANRIRINDSVMKPSSKPRLVVVSPFLDKRHGTERCVAEQVERLSDAYEIHLYSERVEDIDLSKIKWHWVPVPPGPHVFRYVWWLMANHICRWIDRRFRGVDPDVVYSPGVNCVDADVIAVHIVFAEFLEQVSEELKLRRNPWQSWPVLLHRRMYYVICEFLERRAYRNDRVVLVAVSEKTARAVVNFSGRKGSVDVVYNGIDIERFNPCRRLAMRASARATLGLSEDAFVVLLVGNDWKKKGLPPLLEAAGRLGDPRLRLLVVGRDTTAPYQEMIRRLGIAEQVSFLPSRPDVEFYYAAADMYAGPSLDDSFALPPAEAMASGLPVITSRCNGGSAIIHHGRDGLILEDPSDTKTLSQWLAKLANDVDWRSLLGEAAAYTAAEYTWERNASRMRDVIDRARIARRETLSGAKSG
jgi:glycosyltransferase involved in cell wall biosynthesis